MAVILYCSHQACGVGYAVSGAIPIVCPSCGRETKWIVTPFTFTRDDKDFLKTNKISSA